MTAAPTATPDRYFAGTVNRHPEHACRSPPAASSLFVTSSQAFSGRYLVLHVLPVLQYHQLPRLCRHRAVDKLNNRLVSNISISIILYIYIYTHTYKYMLLHKNLTQLLKKALKKVQQAAHERLRRGQWALIPLPSLHDLRIPSLTPSFPQTQASLFSPFRTS